MKRLPRKILFVLLALIGVGLAVELAGAALYALRFGGWPSSAERGERRRAVIEDRPALLGEAAAGPVPHYEMLHPYLGYVLEHSPKGNSNRLGFVGRPPLFDPAPRRPGEAVVGVFGGSVAQLLVDSARDTLARELERSGCFPGRRITILNFALPGMKQPQQLIALSYLLSIGAHLDLALGLDGFNEVVLPVAENEPLQTSPYFPRAWRYRVAGARDPAVLRAVGEAEFLLDRRRRLARAFSEAPLRWSHAANLVWQGLDDFLNRRIALLRIDISVGDVEGRDRKGYREQGPLRPYRDDDERYRDLAAVWERSIRMMDDVARGAGVSAFFFLQPNQRVPGSKVFTPQERAIAFPANYAYDRPARRGYPHLIEAGRRLAGEGVALTDLTMLFEGDATPLYSDGCCHVNELGSRRIAEAMARAVRDGLARDGRCGPDPPD